MDPFPSRQDLVEVYRPSGGVVGPISFPTGRPDMGMSRKKVWPRSDPCRGVVAADFSVRLPGPSLAGSRGSRRSRDAWGTTDHVFFFLFFFFVGFFAFDWFFFAFKWFS